MCLASSCINHGLVTPKIVCGNPNIGKQELGEGALMSVLRTSGFALTQEDSSESEPTEER